LQEADVQLVVVGCSKVKFIKVKSSVAYVICYTVSSSLKLW